VLKRVTTKKFSGIAVATLVLMGHRTIRWPIFYNKTLRTERLGHDLLR